MRKPPEERKEENILWTRVRTWEKESFLFPAEIPKTSKFHSSVSMRDYVR